MAVVSSTHGFIILFYTICVIISLCAPTTSAATEDWSSIIITGTTKDIDMDDPSRVQFEDAYSSFVFPIKFNARDAQIPLTDGQLFKSTVRYTFKSLSSKQYVGAVSLCLLSSAQLPQALWVRTHLWESYCQVNRVFSIDGSTADDDEQVEEFLNDTLRTGAAFGVLLLRVSNLTVPSYVAGLHAYTEWYNEHNKTINASSGDKLDLNTYHDDLPEPSHLVPSWFFVGLPDGEYTVNPHVHLTFLGSENLVWQNSVSGETAPVHSVPTIPTPQAQVKVSTRESLVQGVTVSHPLQHEQPPSLAGDDPELDYVFSFQFSLSGTKCITTFGDKCMFPVVPFPKPPSAGDNVRHPFIQLDERHQSSQEITQPPTVAGDIPLRDNDDTVIIIPPKSSMLFGHVPTSLDPTSLVEQIKISLLSDGFLKLYSASSAVPRIDDNNPFFDVSASTTVIPKDEPSTGNGKYIGELVHVRPPFRINEPAPFDVDSPHIFSWFLLLVNPNVKDEVRISQLTYSQYVCIPLPPVKTVKDKPVEDEMHVPNENGQFPSCDFGLINHRADETIHVVTPNKNDSTTPPPLHFAFSPYDAKYPLTVPWRVSIYQYIPAVTGTSLPWGASSMGDSSAPPLPSSASTAPMAPFVIYLRRGALPITPSLSHHGNYHIYLSSFPHLTNYTVFSSHPNQDTPSPLGPVRGSDNADNGTNTAVGDELMPDIWYATVLFSDHSSSLAVWYNDLCPNKCGKGIPPPPSSSPWVTGMGAAPTDDLVHGVCTTRTTPVSPFIQYSFCSCSDKFTGLDCTTPIDDDRGSSSFLQKYYIYLIIGGVTLGIILIILFIYCVKRRSKATREKDSFGYRDDFRQHFKNSTDPKATAHVYSNYLAPLSSDYGGGLLSEDILNPQHSLGHRKSPYHHHQQQQHQQQMKRSRHSDLQASSSNMTSGPGLVNATIYNGGAGQQQYIAPDDYVLSTSTSSHRLLQRQHAGSQLETASVSSGSIVIPNTAHPQQYPTNIYRNSRDHSLPTGVVRGPGSMSGSGLGVGYVAGPGSATSTTTTPGLHRASRQSGTSGSSQQHRPGHGAVKSPPGSSVGGTTAIPPNAHQSAHSGISLGSNHSGIPSEYLDRSVHNYSFSPNPSIDLDLAAPPPPASTLTPSLLLNPQRHNNSHGNGNVPGNTHYQHHQGRR